MRLGNFEFGISRPLEWEPFQKEVPACGCVIYSFGFWYLTILNEECKKLFDYK